MISDISIESVSHFSAAGILDPMKILFLHGWHSVPGGVKPTYLKDQGYQVINPALDDDDFDAALRTAQAEFDRHRPDVVVGSSRGGAVAMNIRSNGARLVLLCPAWKNWGMAKTVKLGTVILHSQNDEVIPVADSELLVSNSGLPECSLIEVGADHRLADSKSLAAMLGACVRGLETNACIELHDSCVNQIESNHDFIVVRFRPAYIHRSTGRPGFDPGSGLVQEVDLIFEHAIMRSKFTELPCHIWDGSLFVDAVTLNNEIPFPIDARGDIRVAFESRAGEVVDIRAKQIRTVAIGKARYVEEFCGIA